MMKSIFAILFIVVTLTACNNTTNPTEITDSTAVDSTAVDSAVVVGLPVDGSVTAE